MKLRVCGAELASSRPTDPLDPSARTACLRLSYNGTSPASWDAKLGLDPMGATLRYGQQVAVHQVLVLPPGSASLVTSTMYPWRT
jgi:hypothetical protein